jgi:hypothetical protein
VATISTDLCYPPRVSAMATAPTPHELYPNLFPPPEAPLDQQQQHQQPQEPPRQSPKEQAGEERQPSVESPSFSSRPSVGRAAATTEASPPPTSEPVKKPFISKAGELTRFEVLDTLGWSYLSLLVPSLILLRRLELTSFSPYAYSILGTGTHVHSSSVRLQRLEMAS